MFLFILIVILAFVLFGSPYSVPLALLATTLLATGYVDFDCQEPFEDITGTADNDANISSIITDEYDASNVENVVRKYLHTDQSSGDQQLYERMQRVAQGPEKSMMLTARRNQNNFGRYYKKELDDTERRVWWEIDTLDHF